MQEEDFIFGQFSLDVISLSILLNVFLRSSL